MPILYNLAYSVFGLFYLPVFLAKIKQEPDRGRLIRMRMGRPDPEWALRVKGKEIIWLHAVSVGEVMAVRKFIETFLARCPAVHLVLTTVTPTGQKVARELACDQVSVGYFPFDWTGPVRRFFQLLKPKCLLLAETEVWPNLLVEAGRSGVPVGILNARLSEKSFRHYSHLAWIFRPLFRRLSFVLAQTEKDADRFLQLGVESEKIEIFGNMKFDNIAPVPISEGLRASLRREWHFEPHDRILVAGSTHPGEDEILRHAFLKLREMESSVKLVIAPRHIERSEKICQDLRRFGLRVRLATGISPSEKFEVLVLNKIGVLKNLYAMADVVFMGGSLVPRGGQNPIEPACVERAIVHGPYIFNFEEVYRVLDQEGAALMVRDEAQLVFAIKRSLQNESERRNLGASAVRVIGGLQGSTGRHVDWLLNFLLPDSLERTNDVETHEKLFPFTSPRA